METNSTESKRQTTDLPHCARCGWRQDHHFYAVADAHAFVSDRKEAV